MGKGRRTQPHSQLQSTRAFLRRRREPVEHSMRLEDQGVQRKYNEALIDEIVRETNPGKFWE